MAIRKQLEGGMVVEMNNGDFRNIRYTPTDGIVVHSPSGAAFAGTETTLEAEFRAAAKRVVSKSTYCRR
jgi:hypothetical protein